MSRGALIKNFEETLSRGEKKIIQDKKNHLKSAFLTPYEFYECVLSALRRMAVTLNENRTNSPFYKLKLRNKSDDEICQFFTKKKLIGRKLVPIITEQFNLSNPKISNQDLAENFFYGELQLKNNSDGTTGLNYTITTGFFKYLYFGYNKPIGHENIGRNQLIKCNTNYILRNLWHNFIHVSIHGWTNQNYHNFKGDCRILADFEADNLSSILLTYSYGLNPNSKENVVNEKKIEVLFSENRCNDVFRIRNDKRKNENKVKTKAQSLSDFLEQEWRFRRSLGSSLAFHLIKAGLTCTTFSIFPYGEINNEHPWRQSDRIIFELNGRRFFYRHGNKIPTYTDSQYREFFNRISPQIVNEYKAFRNDNPHHQMYSEANLNLFLKRVGILV